ncbi:MAG: RbsD/FucU family protein [Asticcacaulis sp.]
MLKGIDPILGPELLGYLRAMGHGDEIVISDANFPSVSSARRLVRLDGLMADRVARAILSIMPLDEYVPAAAARMAVVEDAEAEPDICRIFASELRQSGYEGPLEVVERHAFYARAREAFVIVVTGETRLYGNLILKKGIIRPE